MLLRFWLAQISRLILLNHLVLTIFGVRLRYPIKWHQRCWITTEKGTATEKPWGSGPDEEKGVGGAVIIQKAGRSIGANQNFQVSEWTGENVLLVKCVIFGNGDTPSNIMCKVINFRIILIVINTICWRRIICLKIILQVQEDDK